MGYSDNGSTSRICQAVKRVVMALRQANQEEKKKWTPSRWTRGFVTQPDFSGAPPAC
jgi:hypothetical protein